MNLLLLHLFSVNEETPQILCLANDECSNTVPTLTWTAFIYLEAY